MFSYINRITNHAAMNVCANLASLFDEKGKVLMFHDIGNSAGELNLDVPTFESILTKVTKVDLCFLLEGCPEKKFVSITFDDVMSSFYENAYPLLREYSCPFTLFVNLSLLDTHGFLTTKQLIELSSDPLCTVGSHGMKHGYFSSYTEDEALNDMKESKYRLQQLTGQSIDLFAFPYGSFFACGWTKHKLVRQVYKYGFSTISAPIVRRGYMPCGFLPRINVDNNTINNIVL